MPAGYSGTPLAKKLGIREGTVVEVINPPPNYATLVKPLPKGAILISWPKKAWKVATDITEDVIRAECLPLGFVDIKVCAVDETWSGLKLVIRAELRKR